MVPELARLLDDLHGAFLPALAAGGLSASVWVYAQGYPAAYLEGLRERFAGGRSLRVIAAERPHRRIGDVVALARGTWALTASEREPGPSRLAAYHGSLTATELAIPLLVARGASLS